MHASASDMYSALIRLVPVYCKQELQGKVDGSVLLSELHHVRSTLPI